MLGTIKVLLIAWGAMFALVMGMRIVLVTVKRPPIPEWLRVPFELSHMAVAGVGGGWLCVRNGPDSPLLYAWLLGMFCGGIELLSLRLGWTTFDLAHSVAGIVVAPVAIMLGALLFPGF